MLSRRMLGIRTSEIRLLKALLSSRDFTSVEKHRLDQMFSAPWFYLSFSSECVEYLYYSCYPWESSKEYLDLWTQSTGGCIIHRLLLIAWAWRSCWSRTDRCSSFGRTRHCGWSKLSCIDIFLRVKNKSDTWSLVLSIWDTQTHTNTHKHTLWVWRNFEHY